jgi:putative ABC transport system permease protein
MKNQKLKFSELFSLSLRSFKNKPQRAFLTILGMSVGIATVLLLVSLGYGLQYILIGKLMTTEDSLITMEISYPTESNLSIKRSTLDKIKEYNEVAEVSSIAEFPGEMSLSDGYSILIDSKIIEPNYFRLSGSLPSIGKIPSEKLLEEIVITSPTLAPMNMTSAEESLKREANFIIFYQDYITNSYEETINKIPLKISGIIEDDSTIPMAILFSSVLEKEPPFYTKALVKAKNTEVLETLRDNLQKDGFYVSAKIDLVTQARKFTNIITIILGVFGVTALVVSAIGMFNTMLVGFLERIYEVGILKSIGATDHDVRNLFLVESSIMGFMGGIGGIIIGVGGGWALNLLVSVFSKQFGGEAIRLFLTPWPFVGLILIFSIIIGVISGWLPAHRAAGLSPKEAFTKR